MIGETGRCTASWQDVVVDTFHKDQPFTVFQLQYISLVTVNCAPEDSYGILDWTMLFININTVYVIEFEVA